MSEEGRYGVGPNEGEPHECSICGAIYYGFGNNAWPVNNGRCCDRCNREAVIPERIRGAVTTRGRPKAT